MTTMNELLFVSIPLTAGLGLGAFFFGGLWWTVNHAVASKRPAVWLLGSKLAADGRRPGGILSCRGRALGALAAVPGWLCHGARRDMVADPLAGAESRRSDARGPLCALVRTT